MRSGQGRERETSEEHGMLRDAAMSSGDSGESHFAWRGVNVSRAENFADASLHRPHV